MSIVLGYLCTMKMIYIVRHAKSDWSIEGMADIDRPLNERGYTDAHKIGKVLKSKGHIPQAMISSPAIRALSTALIIAEELEFPKQKLLIEPLFYDTSKLDYLKILKSLNDDIQSVAIYGHNPIVSDLSSFLTVKTIEMPTCAVVQLQISVDKWSMLSHENVVLLQILSPKHLPI